MQIGILIKIFCSLSRFASFFIISFIDDKFIELCCHNKHTSYIHIIMSITASISKPYAMKGAHRLEYCQFIQPAWKSNLTALSKMASVLCMVDCTLLPVITLLLPLIGLAGGDETWLHDLGHLMALYFVLPGT